MYSDLKNVFHENKLNHNQILNRLCYNIRCVISSDVIHLFVMFLSHIIILIINYVKHVLGTKEIWRKGNHFNIAVIHVFLSFFTVSVI